MGFSAAWVQGTDITAVAPHFSLDLTTRAPCHLSEILDHNIDDGSVWVAQACGWIGVLPGKSDDAFLRTLSAGGGQAIGLAMNIVTTPVSATPATGGPSSPPTREASKTRHSATA